MIKLKLLLIIFLYFTWANAQWVVQQVPTSNRLNDIYFADSTHGWVSGYDGIFYTTDGGYNWEQQSADYADQLSGLNNNEIWISGLSDTLLHTTNAGISWDRVSLINFTDLDTVRYVGDLQFINSSNGWIYLVGLITGLNNGRLLRTIDGGISWQMMTCPNPTFVAYIQFFDSTNGFYTGDGIALYVTSDGGTSWEQLDWYGYIYTLDMQFTSRSNGWISTDGPVLSTLVWQTTDGGENFYINRVFDCSDLTTYLSFVDTLIGWVVQSTCLFGGRNEIWHTTDGGAYWELQYVTVSPFSFSPREIFFVDSLHGWVIGENGIVLHTSTGGVIPVELISFNAEIIEDGVMLNWTTATETNNSGFEILRFTQNDNVWETIGFVPGFGTITESKSYSFVDENLTTGTYKYRLKQIDYDGTFNYSKVIEVKVDFMPKEFVLYQNYPNPFNPTTKIKYTIAENGTVSLKIYDLLGREITTLVDKKQEQGSYQVNWDASHYTSGIYFYTLTTNNFTQTKKLILLK